MGIPTIGQHAVKKRKRQQAHYGAAHAKTHGTKQRLNLGQGSPRNGMLNQAIRKHQLSNS